jgi:predicted nucleic acid-binding protein
MSVYFDASAILPLLVVEASTPVAQRFVDQLDTPMFVSEFAAIEVASGLSRLTRMGALDRATGDRHVADFDIWRTSFTIPAEILPVDLSVANGFVRRFELGLRAPDALHAAICRRADHDLVTLDRRLAAAASALGVRVELLA